MKNFIRASIIAGLVAVLITVPVMAGFTISPQILAGQSEFAGVVKITGNTDGSMTFLFMLKGGEGYCMTEAQLHAGLSLDDFPTNRGGAIPGQFDYKYTFESCISSFQVTIDPPGEKGDLYLAIHMVVMTPDGEETGWVVRCGDLIGAQFPGKNWSAWIYFPEQTWN